MLLVEDKLYFQFTICMLRSDFRQLHKGLDQEIEENESKYHFFIF
jgi:hypothetical protein